jgi:hypothetical protein
MSTPSICCNPLRHSLHFSRFCKDAPPLLPLPALSSQLDLLNRQIE